MKTILKSLLLLTVVFFATAAFAADRLKVDVPFSFTTMGQSFPAGEYNIAMNANHCVLTLSSQSDTAMHVAFVVRPTDPRPAPGIVTFDAQGDHYSLRNIQVEGRITPNLDTHTSRGISATTSVSDR
jgi:hypothetical protein